MKHFHFRSAMVCAFPLAMLFSLSSCQKAIDEDISSTSHMPQGTPAKVIFTLDGFTQSREPSSAKHLSSPRTPITRAAASAASDVAKRIDFVVFYGNDVAFQAHQTDSDAGFGTLTANLTPGDYSIVAVAHNGQQEAIISMPTKVTFNGNRLSDTFAYGGNVTITDNDTGHNLTLRRAVACFRLKTTDAIPDTVAQMKFYYLQGSSTLNPVTLQGTANSKQTEIFDIAQDQHGRVGQWDIFTFPKTTDGTGKLVVQVQALDKSGNVVYEKLFSDADIERGYRTVYTGNFFGGSTAAQGGGFQVGFEEVEWKDKTEITY